MTLIAGCTYAASAGRMPDPGVPLPGGIYAALYRVPEPAPGPLAFAVLAVLGVWARRPR